MVIVQLTWKALSPSSTGSELTSSQRLHELYAIQLARLCWTVTYTMIVTAVFGPQSSIPKLVGPRP